MEGFSRHLWTRISGKLRGDMPPSVALCESGTKPKVYSYPLGRYSMNCPLCESTIKPGYETYAACGATKRCRIVRRDMVVILIVCFVTVVLFATTTYVAILAVIDGNGGIDLVVLVILVGLSALWLITRWAKCGSSNPQ